MGVDVNYILVDKEKIEKEGQVVYRLYLLDIMDGHTIQFDSPVFKTTKVPKFVTVIPELPTPSIEAMEEKVEELVEDLEEEEEVIPDAI
jgi:hypothetical protein